MSRQEELVTSSAVAPRTGTIAFRPRGIAVLAHRDNLGASPGAVDNGSGTGALLELARDLGSASLSHPFILVSTDGGALGGLGAEHFAEAAPYAESLAAVVNLDASWAAGPPSSRRRPRASRTLRSSRRPTQLRAQSVLDRPPRPFAHRDLSFPFSFYEQAPFVSRGVPAVTITTGTSRPRSPEGDTLAALNGERLGELGLASQSLLGSLDEAAEVTSGTQSYIYFGTRLLYGWTLQFVLLAALLPFLAATVDLFARCRRRHIPLVPALRSYLSRLCVWLWLGLGFAVFVAAGVLPSGADRPLGPTPTRRAIGPWRPSRPWQRSPRSPGWS